MTCNGIQHWTYGSRWFIVGRVTTAPAILDTDGGHLPGSAAQRHISVALFAAGVATFALLYSTQALLPAIASAYDVSTAASTLSLSLTTLGLGAALLVVGPLSDVIGRTRLIHLSLASSVVVAAASAVAPTWGVFLALRLLEGVTLAGLPAVATAYLREELHPSTHSRAVGLYVGGTALGGMTGRLVTGFVGQPFGWRWALASMALIGLGCAVVVRLLLPASRRFVSAPTGARALVSMSRRAVSDPALLALYAIGGCSIGVLVAVFNTLGFRLADAPFHLGLAAASLVFLVYPLGSLSSVLAGRLADAFGRRAVLPVGCVIALAGVLLTIPSSLVTIVVGLALVTIGFFAVHGVASGWVPARAHAGGVATGQAASLYLFTYYLGSSVLGSVAGHAWTADGWSGVVVMTSLLLAVTFGLGLLLRRTPTLLDASPQHREAAHQPH
jgi:YNFM family putative membrane transporter